MVDRKRIELFPKACKAPVLPLSLTAHKLVGVERIELPQEASKTSALPLCNTPIEMAEKVRVELTEAVTPRQFSKLL